MPDLLGDLSVVTVNMALSRRNRHWDESNSHVEHEQAYLDRLVLAEYIDLLRDELRHTQDAQHEAEMEVETLQHALQNIDFE